MSKGRPSRRRRFSREPRLEALEARQLLASDISNEAMEFIYELNLARHDPQAYAVAAGLPAAMLAGVEAQPPLALNDELENSALFHATEMAAYDYFDHQSAITGDWPNQMAVDAGYPLPSNYPLTSNYIESIAAGTFLSNPNEVLRLLIEDEGLSTPGHRYHLLATGPSQSFWETHREIGVGHAYSPVATYRNYWAVHTAPRTEQLTFLTGVVFDDANSNGSFDAGEGLGDVTIDVNGTTVVTNSAGGWKLAVSAGDYVITASGGNLAGAASTTATVGADNVEVDFVSGNVNGFVNFAEVAIPPSVDPPPADWVRTSRELGAVNAGVAARDGATGEGYLMHSRQPVHERFGDLPAGNSDHLVVVVYQDGQWSYDNDNALVPFVPVSTDVLLAQVDFDADTVTSLENLETETNGIATGYVGGDLQFAADIWSGAADDGEFTVTGAAFAALGPADRYELGATNLGIAADESATGVGYILYSQIPVAERFTNVTIANGNSDHLVVIQFVDGQWILDANGSRRVFTPRSDDLLLAEVDYDADTVTALQGQSLWRDGIRAGYVDGDLAFAANVWAGAPNDGEFGVSGAWFTAAEPEKLTWQADPGAGVRVRDDATGTGYLMLSETSLRARFPASDWPADSSDQFVAVVFTAGQWYFDNDTELTPFLPESSDLLVAALDFDNNTATLLDRFGWRHGIRSGFTGSLTVAPEQFNGSAAPGEFEVTVSALQRLDEQPRVTMPTGPLGQGLAANDGATGSGYIMYSPQSVHERFSGIPAAVSDHFIVVIHQQGVWKYDNNGQIREFTPLAGDTLVASIDFDASQVTALAGVRGLVHGMPSGYLDGDLVFYADQYAGVPNDGEFQVGGTYLTTNVASARYQIGALGQGIAANDLASGEAYLLYSAESLFDRFSNAPIPALNSEHLIIAFYANNQWHFDANGATRTFTPRETDV
ncbi:MAG: hypothetical protein KDB14_14860, partial [Planctomycetales bacterium]|nr:hypothetical protein [Planctomycetales bacterium]